MFSYSWDSASNITSTLASSGGTRGKALCSVRSSKSHGPDNIWSSADIWVLCFFPATARTCHDSVLAEVSCLQLSIATSKGTTRDFRKSAHTHEVTFITGQTVELNFNAHQPLSCLTQLTKPWWFILSLCHFSLVSQFGYLSVKNRNSVRRQAGAAGLFQFFLLVPKCETARLKIALL